MRQTICLLLLLTALISCKSKETSTQKVQLICMEDVSPATLTYLQKELESAFNVEVSIARDTLFPASKAWYAPHKRFWADSLLVQIKKKFPYQKEFIMLGVTGKDISTSLHGEPNRGIMGLSYQGGCCAIISDYRLHQMDRTRDSIDFYLAKVAMHEVGHCLGLSHCAVAGCLMEDAAVKHHITSIHEFCETCKKVIHRR